MAYDWIVDGKIGCHFPERGEQAAVNFDVKRIVYSDDGNQNNIKEIESVYYVDAAAAASILAKPTLAEQIEELHKWTVWHRYWGQIVNRQLAMNTDGNYVLMKYLAPRTETVNTIGIFTTGTSTNGRSVYILSNDGILIGKGTSSEQTDVDVTIHGLTATRRTMTLSNSVTFEQGKTYWIQYYFENCQNEPDAYYVGEQGTEYKNITLNNYVNADPVDMTGKTILDTSSIQHQWDLIIAVLALSENTIFKLPFGMYSPVNWGGQGNWLYRTSSLSSAVYGTTIVRDSDNYTPTLSEVLAEPVNNYFISRAANSSNPEQAWGLYKRSSVVVDIPAGLNGVTVANVQEYSELLTENTLVSGKTFNLADTGPWPHQISAGLYKRRSEGTFGYTHGSSPVSTEPENPTIGYVYYGTGAWVGYNSKLMIYLGNNQWEVFDIITTYNLSNGNTVKFFDKLDDSDIYSVVNAQSMATAMNPQPTQIDISSQSLNDKAHYLEINGNEVT